MNIHDTNSTIIPQVLTHRGLEPDNIGFFSEGSHEAFNDHISRGFGIEFDINFTADGQILILHDDCLGRITNGADMRYISEMTTLEAQSITLPSGHICSLNELLESIKSGTAAINALHLKGNLQTPANLDTLIVILKNNPLLLNRLLIFDVTIETAKYLKKRIPELQLAPSVSHGHDIDRYNSFAHGTLMQINTAIDNQNLFDWVWLDEWDRKDVNNNKKSIYTAEIIERIRDKNMKVAIVSPELHATSPKLLGGEHHEDALNDEMLKKRMKEIVRLRPDAICTDFPTIMIEIIKKYDNNY